MSKAAEIKAKTEDKRKGGKEEDNSKKKGHNQGPPNFLRNFGAAFIVVFGVLIFTMQPFESALALTGIVTAGFQFVFFIITAVFKFDKLTDFAGGINFVIDAIITYFVFGHYSASQTIFTLFVIAWGIRLAIFLFTRIMMWGEDRRFDDKRDNPVRLLVFWTLQAVWVFTVSLPLTLTNSTDKNIDIPIQPQEYIGWTLMLIGLSIETIADFQKLFHKKREPKKWCTAGLWKYSRHPNYFGEILFWWSAFITSTGPLSQTSNSFLIGVAILSPILISLLLLFVSGMPLLERPADRRFLSDPQWAESYAEYKKQTSPLIPLPPALYGALPPILKIFLLELPLYNVKNVQISG